MNFVLAHLHSPSQRYPFVETLTSNAFGKRRKKPEIRGEPSPLLSSEIRGEPSPLLSSFLSFARMPRLFLSFLVYQWECNSTSSI